MAEANRGSAGAIGVVATEIKVICGGADVRKGTNVSGPKGRPVGVILNAPV
jgi:hypothetical protein